VSTRVADSGDAQVVSANLVPDVQSALELTTDPSASQCGPGTQLLGLESNLNASTGVYETVISYSELASGSSYELVREDCTSGASSTPTSSTVVSYNVESTLSSSNAVTISPSQVNATAQSGWISSEDVSNVQFNVTEPETNGTDYTYSLSAVPFSSAPASTAGSPIVSATNTTCGFAPTDGGTVSNGYYASTLCFVDFSSYNASEAAYPDCQPFVASIPGGDTLSFCMSESGTQPMEASALPTYPEAFLGNTLSNGSSTAPFYTALGCPDDTPAESGSSPTASCIEPAMYQTDTGAGPTNTLEFTDISVTTATGAPATGWEWVSADAETTDTGEYITWTMPNGPDLYDLPNTPTSAYGDTCDDAPSSSPSSLDGLQGLGTTSVTCASSSQEPSSTKTGTPMVEALTPTAMTITMKGAGLEGIAVGLLLS
jgi:hypothetical protein